MKAMDWEACMQAGRPVNTLGHKEGPISERSFRNRVGYIYGSFTVNLAGAPCHILTHRSRPERVEGPARTTFVRSLAEQGPGV
jgi:hypothetical protein